MIIMKRNFRVTILTKSDGVMTTYWYYREQAIDFLNKYSDIDDDFISGIIECETRCCHEVIYFRSK